MIPLLFAVIGDRMARRETTPGKHRASNPDADFPRFEQPSGDVMERRPERRLSPDSSVTTPSPEGPKNDTPAGATASYPAGRGAIQGGTR